MIIQCPSCEKKYNVESSKVTAKGVKITCPSCKHQFIVRKKGDEKPAEPKKKGPPQKKGPPCAVCGEPSTHVFKGPPPRPLCEHHFKVEQEKGSRFFESTEVSMPGFMPEPDKTRFADEEEPDITKPPAPPPPAPEDKVPQPEPPAAPAPPKPLDETVRAQPPGLSDPPFESFDSEFDFFDAPDVSHPEREVSQPGREKPEEKGGREADFVSEPHELMQPEAGLIEAQDEAASEDMAATGMEIDTDVFEEDFESVKEESLPQRPAPSPGDTAPPASRKGPPDPVEAAGKTEVKPRPDPFAPEPEEKAAPPGADPFKPNAVAETFEEPAPDPFGPEPGEEQSSPEWSVDDMGAAAAGYYMDGSSAPAMDEPAPGESADSFEWETFEESGRKEESVIEAPAPAPARPAPVPVRQPVQAARPVKPRGALSAVTVLAGLFLAVGASAFLSMKGIPGAPGPEADYAAVVPAWRGRLDVAAESAMADGMFNQLQGLSGAALPDDTGERFRARQRAASARKLMMKDTPEDYKEAANAIFEAVRIEPDNPAYHVLKVNILAFKDTLKDDGRVSLGSGGEAEDALGSLSSEIRKSELMHRAKAHVFLKDNKTAAARSLLTAYLEQKPRDAIALYLLGLTYLYQPKPDLSEAAARLEEAVKFEPDLVRAYWDLAGIYRELGRYEDAIDMYRQVLTRSPDRPGTPEAMEEVLREQGSGSADTSGGDDSSIIVIQHKEEPKGIKATGSAISDNILEAINEVYPEIRKFDFTPREERPGAQPRSYPRPPEEAPRPKPPEEAPR